MFKHKLVNEELQVQRARCSPSLRNCNQLLNLMEYFHIVFRCHKISCTFLSVDLSLKDLSWRQKENVLYLY